MITNDTALNTFHQRFNDNLQSEIPPIPGERAAYAAVPWACTYLMLGAS